VGGKTVETLHLIDAARPYAEVVLDKTGNAETRYLHTPDGLGELIAEQSGSQTLRYHADGQGSTRLVTDPAQSIQEILSFDAFGKRSDAFGQSADALSAIHHQYVGEYADHTGLYNLRARHYDPQLGRFVSMDEFAGRLTQPLSLNKYGYAHGDPVGGRDPSGLFTLGGLGAASNIQSVLANIQADFGSNLISNALDGGASYSSSMGWGVIASVAPWGAKLITRGLIQSKKGLGWVRWSKKTPATAKEIAAAEHLAEKTGARIYLRGEGVEGADALYNGHMYDIKTVKGKNGVYQNIRESLKKGQADRFIIDGRPGGLTRELLDSEIARLERNGRSPTEIIAILGDGSIVYWP
jgi:RHS repeat-associated protein